MVSSIDTESRGSISAAPGTSAPTLPGLPHSTEFLDAYQAALAGTPRTEIGAARSKPGTVAAAVAGYFGSMAFATLAESTQRTRQPILERFRNEHGSNGIGALARRHVEKMLNAKAGTPGMALNFLAALREP